MLTDSQISMLLDLVDNKLTCMSVFDADDRKIRALLVGAKKGLEAMSADSRRRPAARAV